MFFKRKFNELFVPIKKNPNLFRLGFHKKSDEPSPKDKHRRSENKKPYFERNRVFQKKGDDILSHITAVPSAQAGLTTLFGMGRGEPRRNNHLKVFSLELTAVSF